MRHIRDKVYVIEGTELIGANGPFLKIITREVTRRVSYKIESFWPGVILNKRGHGWSREQKRSLNAKRKKKKKATQPRFRSHNPLLTDVRSILCPISHSILWPAATYFIKDGRLNVQLLPNIKWQKYLVSKLVSTITRATELRFLCVTAVRLFESRLQLNDIYPEEGEEGSNSPPSHCRWKLTTLRETESKSCPSALAITAAWRLEPDWTTGRRHEYESSVQVTNAQPSLARPEPTQRANNLGESHHLNP